jgi:glycerate kinase
VTGSRGQSADQRGAGVRVVVAPDKFKGSLTASAVAEHLAVGLRAALPGGEVVGVPVADGGDGTVQAAVTAGYAPVRVRVTGPVGQPVEATFALGDGSALGAPGITVAVVELATASGLAVLPRAPDGRPRLDPLGSGSRGTGELVRAALDAGAGLVVLGVGGSACTDGGAGLLSALGARLTDEDGAPLPDGGGALVRLGAVDLSGLDARLARTRFLLAADVDHPLLGDRGAAAVFGPQKGAAPAQVGRLERGLRRWSDALAHLDPTTAGAAAAPGAGAAGGVGFAALAVLHAELRPGIELVLGLTGLGGLVAGADLVVTGEGSLDEQSLGGKAPVGVARLARRHGVPVVVVCGQTTLTPAQAADAGFAAVYPLTDDADLAECIARPGPLLEEIGRRIGQRLDQTLAGR